MSWWFGLDSEIYVSLDEVKAARETSQRHLPPALGTPSARPTAVLARQVATPNYETMWFTRLARRHGFRPVVIEHRADRFTVHNPTKRALTTLPIITGRSKNGQPILRRQRMVEAAAAEGRRLSEIETTSGEGLLDYHHRKLREVMGDETPEIMDLADILPDGPTRPSSYYVDFFRMLSGGLVLLEDFVACAQTAAFFQSTVMPAWRQVVSETGRRPQIARLMHGKRVMSPLWFAYPGAMADDPTWIRATRRAEFDKATAA